MLVGHAVFTFICSLTLGKLLVDPETFDEFAFK